MSAIYLGVNIDHVATLRNARGTKYPDPVHAAEIAERAGADGITIHLRKTAAISSIVTFMFCATLSRPA